MLSLKKEKNWVKCLMNSIRARIICPVNLLLSLNVIVRILINLWKAYRTGHRQRSPNTKKRYSG
jgi:hypothetical protein